MTKCIQLFS